MQDALRFGRMEVRPRERQVLVDGVAAGVGGRAFDLLLALIERRERLVPKAELLDTVWPGLVVEENNLQVQVSTLRKVLGPQAIATVPGRGYRFTGALDEEPGPSPGRSPAASAATASLLPPRRTNLPAERPVLYGRETEMRELDALLAGERLITVVGAGGIGKSRLAQACAHAAVGRHADGVWLIDLVGLLEPDLLPNTVASVLDTTLTGKRAALEELTAAIASKSMLLVLDNCEHLLDAVGALVESIRRDAPGVRILATSQEPLHVVAEQQFRLMPLAVPASAGPTEARTFGAVALFEARVRAVDPRFTLNDETTPPAIDICRRLDGLPLAIELAAARVGTLGLRAVRDKLDARFKLLTGGTRSTLRRHQTLRAALEWSHNLLTDDERKVFRRLGVFAGGLTMELAQAVAADDRLDAWAVLEQLSALVDKSLVVADPGEPPRYRLLDSARAFALEQLAAGETAIILRRHATAMLDFLRRIDAAALDGELGTDEYAALVMPELDNLRAAYAWANGEEGDPALAIALAAHAGSLIDYVVECAGWLLPHRTRVESGAVDAAVAARYWYALAASNTERRQSAAQRGDAAVRAVAAYKALGKPRRVLDCLNRLVAYARALGDRTTMLAALAEARGLIEPDWPTPFHVRMLCLEGSVARHEGRLAEALATYRAEVELSQTTGDWRLQVQARTSLIDTLWLMGPLDEAAREARRLIDDFGQRPAAPSATDMAYANLVGILSESNRLDEALDTGRVLLPLLSGVNCGFLEEWLHLFARLGQPTVAAMLLGTLDAHIEATGLPSQPNEQRLVSQARATLDAVLPADALARYRASGAVLSREQLYELLSDALAQAASATVPTQAERPPSGGRSAERRTPVLN